MYVALDIINNGEDINWIRKNQGGSDISFISDNWVHQVIVLSYKDLFKIKILQQDYDKISNNNKKSEYRCHTYFLFPATEDEDTILDQLEEMNITMPHSIVFFKNDDMTKKPAYNIYKQDK